jgi:hypothetical protein
MSSPDYNAVILTPFHSITGTLVLRDQRLSDLLNDHRESAIRLRNVKVSRLGEPEKVVVEHSTAVIAKDEIVIAFEPPQRVNQSAKRLYSYVKRQQHEIFVVLDGFEVRGVVHTLGSIDPLDLHELITIQKERFLPVTHARITFASDERRVIEQDAIIINVQRVHYMAKGDA